MKLPVEHGFGPYKPGEIVWTLTSKGSPWPNQVSKHGRFIRLSEAERDKMLKVTK